MEYASKAVGTAALTTGIIGTSLGAISSAGGLAGILGIGPRNVPPVDPGDKPVTRYEMGLIQQINEKNIEIAKLEGEKYTNFKSDGLQAQINQQATWIAGATPTMAFMNQQIQQLFSITKLGVPESSIIIPAAPATATQTSSNG